MFNRFKAKQMCAKAVLEINDYELVNEREIREIIHRYRWLYKVGPYTPVDGPLGEFHKLYGALLKLGLYLNEKQNAIIARFGAEDITQEKVNDLMSYDSGKGKILEQAQRAAGEGR